MEREIIYRYGDIYDDGYVYFEQADGTAWFEDQSTVSELTHKLNHPEYIKYDEHKGWIFKNGKNLPWA